MERKLSSREIKVARWFRKSTGNQLLMVLGQLVFALGIVLILQWIWPVGQTWTYMLTFDAIVILPVGFFLWIWDCLSTPSLEELEKGVK